METQNLQSERVLKDPELLLKDQIKQQSYVDRLLSQNSQAIYQLQDINKTLMKSVSFYLYYSTLYDKYLIEQCLKYLSKQKNQLNQKLQAFQLNANLFQEYFQDPENLAFEKITLQLLSLSLNIKLIIYMAPNEEYFLNSTIITNGSLHVVELFKNLKGEYAPIFPLDQLENLKFCRNIVENLIDQQNFEEVQKDIFQTPKKKGDNIEKKTEIIDLKTAYTIDSPLNKNTEQKQDKTKPSKPIQYFFSNEMFSDLKENNQINQQQIQQSPLIQQKFQQQPPGIRPLISVAQFIPYQQSNQGTFLHNIRFSNNLPQDSPQQQKKPSNKPIILDEDKTRYKGRLKFFDESKQYGFIVMDTDKSDVFVHYDDLNKANISKEQLKSIKSGNILRFSFACMNYIGKYSKSRKAVDIQIEE